MVSETHLVIIDNQLRLVLFGLECVLNAEFSVEAVEKIFSDSDEDAVSEKRYTLWVAKYHKVTGYVQDYEPGDIWLTVESVKAFSPLLSTIIERAKYQAYRLERWKDRELLYAGDHAAMD